MYKIFYNEPVTDAILVLLAFSIITRTFVWILEKIILRLTAKTKTKFDDEIFSAVNNPLTLLIILAGLRLATLRIQDHVFFKPELQATVFYIANNFIYSLIIFISTIVLVRIIDIFMAHFGSKLVKKTKSELDDQILSLFRKAFKVIIFVLSIFYILTIWNIDIFPYLTGLGIARIAVGFAVKDTLSNIIGGIALIFDGNIRIGDKIKLQSGYVGVIEDIGLRTTKMKTYDNEMIIVPNGILSNDIIHNYALPNPLNRVYVDFGVAYGTDPEKVEKVITKTLATIKDAIKDDPVPAIDFLEMADSSLNFRAKFWVENYTKAYSAKIEAVKKIYKALNKANIAIPFPQMDVHMKKK